jgi:small-conductance mechanosensitive channel
MNLNNLNFHTFTADDLRIFTGGLMVFLGVQIFFYVCLRLARKSTTLIKNGELQRVIALNLSTLNWVFCYALAIRFSLSLLVYFDPNILGRAVMLSSWLDNLSYLVLSFFFILLSQQWLIYLFKIVVGKHQKDTEKFDPEGLSLITTLIKFVVWIIGLIIVLQNFNIRGLETVVTSLGITGIAVAFSLQNILSEIFASFSIFLDKPFIVGDYIEIGLDKGYIQRIGLRSTRIRALSGEEVVVSNKELINTRIHNFKLLKSRRVSFDLMLDLRTPLAKLKLVPGMVQSIIEKQPKTKFDRMSFMEIGETKFKFEVVYFVLSNDYMSFTVAQQNINYAILELLEKEGIDLVVV